MKITVKTISGSVIIGGDYSSLATALFEKRADLTGADLRGADLRGADFRGAYLRGAYLTGADGENLKLIGSRPILQLSPIGSRGDTLMAAITDKGVRLHTGCYQWGTLEQFRVRVGQTHGGNEHGEEYFAALALIELHAKHFGK